MKQPWWKVAVSYLYDCRIEDSSSPYNELLSVQLVHGRYQLCTKEAIYSFADKYDNFRKSFEVLSLPDDDDRTIDVLLLGLGLGSIPYMLEKNFQRNYHYTAVEIDEEVIYLASKYVLDELRSEIEVHCRDAYDFIAESERKYDIIAMDIFTGDIVPDIFQSAEFLNMLSDNLTEDGLLMYNRLYQKGTDMQETDLFFDNVFSVVFPDAAYIKMNGNRMLLNTGAYFTDKK